MGKDPSIQEVLGMVAEAFGTEGWTVMDHWEPDMFAMGIARADDPARLVYVSTWRRMPGRYFYECETPPATEEPRRAESSEEYVDSVRLLEVIGRHLRLRRRQPA